MSQPVNGSLDNIGVLVTRPAHQAGPLMQRLKLAGARPIALPVIDIVAAPVTAALQHCMDQLDSYQLVIFISTNAVDHGLEVIEQAGKSLHCPVAAIGRSTATRLQLKGIEVALQPDSGFNSEALLSHDALQVDKLHGRHILIVRGEGGREVLADTLRQRGAQVDYAEVYRRQRPRPDTSEVLALWRNQQIQIVTVTSNEALKNLYHILNKSARELLLATPLVVPGERCGELARQTGFETILTAANATDQAMLDTIQQWHNR